MITFVFSKFISRWMLAIIMQFCEIMFHIYRVFDEYKTGSVHQNNYILCLLLVESLYVRHTSSTNDLHHFIAPGFKCSQSSFFSYICCPGFTSISRELNLYVFRKYILRSRVMLEVNKLVLLVKVFLIEEILLSMLFLLYSIICDPTTQVIELIYFLCQLIPQRYNCAVFSAFVT